MEEIVKKVSTYNIFNYIFPGTLYLVYLEHLWGFRLDSGGVIAYVFAAYFTGLIISRLGSLVIGELFKVIKIVNFTDYEEYIEAERKDPQIKLFSEINNMYRTLVALSVIVFISSSYLPFVKQDERLSVFTAVILPIFLLVLFTLSYRKQTEFITKRIQSSKN